MSNEIKDILNNLNKDAGQEKLLEYLNRQLDENASHEFEEQMIDDPFMDDAVEGLSEMKNKTDLTNLAAELNIKLKKQIELKKQKKAKRNFTMQPATYVAIFTLLLLAVIAFIVIRKYLQA